MFVDLSKRFEEAMEGVDLSKKQNEERDKEQKKANKLKAEESGSLADIVKQLPKLFREQLKDIFHIESRIGLKEGEGEPGVLVTNATGTGKTLTCSAARVYHWTVTNATGTGKTYTK